MIKTGTLEAGMAARKFFDMDKQPGGHNQGLAWRTEIIEGDRATGSGPQAFLVEQGPDSLTGVHFHTEHQFQVIVAGSGTLGRQEVAPYIVHYAAGHTGYGPIKAGAEGLSYLTVRAVPDFAPPYYLPDMRAEMKPLRKVNRHSEQAPAQDEAARQARTAVTCDVLLPPSDAAAWLLRVPPGQVAPVPVHADCGGQFRVVVGGSMVIESKELGHLGCAWVDAAECGLPVVAGAGGLDVLVLQFPAGIWATQSAVQ